MALLRRLALIVLAGLMFASLATPQASATTRTPPPGDDPNGSASGLANGEPGLTVTPLTPSGTVESDKAPSSRLARSDPRLLARTDDAEVSVFVKLDVDPVATYAGDVDGLAATSPSVTGSDLAGRPAEKAYERYLAGKEAAFAADLREVAPDASIDRRLRIVYGGVVATIPADAAKQVQKLPGVVAVQRNQMRHVLTDSSGAFIGAPTLYDQLKATVPDAGRGQILANLDSGVWPEHPSFADKGNLPVPPGPARACVFGDNPLTPAPDPFKCTNKLIGGAAFTKAYDAQVGDDPYAGTARDSEGHGTHTATTSAGDPVSGVSIMSKSLPDIHGIAPGAAIMEYKVCGPQGCFSSDSAAAVGQAIKDGANAINFSISGGTDPFTDPVELAFLDAYAANVFVSASAGNEGPGPGTVNHVAPWVTSVAASSQSREFGSTLTVTAGGKAFSADGVSITKGVGPLPIVLGSASPYGAVLCDKPAAPGTFTGKLVVCQRGGNGRIDKSYNVSLGGAAGMILYNPTLADTETDNHFVPTIHIADGTGLLAFLTANPNSVGQFTEGQPRTGKGDVMAAFSSRGPGGAVLKPDLSAPGVQILAGMTPAPKTPAGGPAGQLYQAIAGTSMSSPHVAGSALLLHALHPSWTPGQIRSALMTTAVTAMTKEDLTTPADPLDRGAGRIDLTKAGSVALTFDESAARMQSLGASASTAIDLNLPSIDAPTLPGRVTTIRTATNTTDHAVSFRAETTSDAGSTVTVSPSSFTVAPGKSVDLSVTIQALQPTGKQGFGEIDLVPAGDSGPALHLPVAFVPKQGPISLTSTCDKTVVVAPDETSTCTVTATNNGTQDGQASFETKADDRLAITAANGATLGGDGTVRKGPVTLKSARPGVPAVAPATASPEGYVPLDSLGIKPTPIGDEEFLNVSTPAFIFAGRTYTSIAVSSNGFVKVGTASAADQNCCNLPSGANPAPPNNVIAPFWTDLDGVGAPGLFAGTMSDGAGHSWVVVEQRMFVYGTTNLRTFETWIGLNGTEDITMTYPPNDRPAAPAGQPLLVGAENDRGEGTMTPTAPTADLRVASTPAATGDTATYTVTVQGRRVGAGQVTTTMKDSLTRTESVVSSPIKVTAPVAGPTAQPLTSTGVGATPQTVSVPVPSGGRVSLLQSGAEVGAVATPGQGSFSVDPSTGAITFTPAAGFVGTASPVVYRVADRYDQTAESTYTPTVQAVVPGAPVATLVVPPVSPIKLSKDTLVVPATCAVSTGEVQGCSVRVIADVDGRERVIGSTGTQVRARQVARGAPAVGVRVRLRPIARRLITRPGGIAVRFDASIRTSAGATIHSSTSSRLVARAYSLRHQPRFASGSSSLSVRERAALARIGLALGSVRRVVCTGHATPSESASTSRDRAEAACAALGLPASVQSVTRSRPIPSSRQVTIGLRY